MIALGLSAGVLHAQKVEFGSEAESSSYRNMPVFLGKHQNKIYTLRITGYNAQVYNQLLRNDTKAAVGAMIMGIAKFSNDAPFNNQKMYYSQNCKVYLEIYDEQLHQISSTQLNIDEKPKGDLLRINRTVMLDGQILAFSYWEDEKGKRNILRAHKISEDGSVEKPGTEILSYPATNDLISGRSNTFSVVPTGDQKHVLLAHTELRFKKGKEGQRTVNLMYCNADLSEVWQHQLEIPLNEENVELSDLQVSNQGNVALLFKYKNPDDKGPDDLYTLFTSYGGKGEVEEFGLKMADKFTNDILLRFEGNDRLLVSGFFSGRSKSSAEGYFYREINTTNSSVMRDVEENFDKDFMTLALGAKKAQKTDALSNFHMRKIIPTKDGGVVLVAEKYYIIYNDNSFTFYYDDAYMLRLDASGALVQTAKVLKSQQTGDDGGLYNSFCVIEGGDALVYIYNANRNEPNDRMSNTNRASVYMTRIPFDGGKEKTEMLFNGKEAETVAVPKVFLQESDASVVFYNYKRGTFKYARVTF